MVKTVNIQRFTDEDSCYQSLSLAEKSPIYRNTIEFKENNNVEVNVYNLCSIQSLQVATTLSQRLGIYQYHKPWQIFKTLARS